MLPNRFGVFQKFYLQRKMWKRSSKTEVSWENLTSELHDTREVHIGTLSLA